MDADNELTHPDYVEFAVKALAANPQALGVEGYYLPSPKMSSFCAYITALLHISDPICWLMSANPRLVARDGEVERWTLPDGTYSYPLGAMFLMKNGKREWLRLRGRGVHHYYVQTLWGFVQKRRRATVHSLQVQEEMPVPLWLAAVYCVTFFGPLWHALRRIVRNGDARWLWHLLAGPASVLSATRGAC